jgi:hypothetical protein
MGDVVRLRARYDLDQLGRYAALTIMAVELARLAVQGDADEIEITLNGERQRLDCAAMLAIAQDMLEQRQAIADAAAGLVERVARATATMGQAEAMLDRST